MRLPIVARWALLERLSGWPEIGRQETNKLLIARPRLTRVSCFSTSIIIVLRTHSCSTDPQPFTMGEIEYRDRQCCSGSSSNLDRKVRCTFQKRSGTWYYCESKGCNRLSFPRATLGLSRGRQGSKAHRLITVMPISTPFAQASGMLSSGIPMLASCTVSTWIPGQRVPLRRWLGEVGKRRCLTDVVESLWDVTGCSL